MRGSDRHGGKVTGDEERARKRKMRTGGRVKRKRRRHEGKECTCLLGFLYKDKSPLASVFSLLYWEHQKPNTSSSDGLQHKTLPSIARKNRRLACKKKKKMFPQLPHPFSIKKILIN